MEDAEEKGEDFLNFYLDVLSFTSATPFRLEKIKFIADWTPGLEERNLVQFNDFPGHELPYPILNVDILDTAEELAEANFDGAFGRALRWFKHGLNASVKDDQFQYFWFVIELLSSFFKQPGKVNDACPKCRSDLYCESCGEHPKHKPYPKQAIEQLFGKIINGDSLTAFTHANKFRNALMHGDEVEPVEKELNVEFEKVVDLVGNVAWHAIVNLFPRRIEEKKTLKLKMAKPDSFLHRVMTVKANMLFYSKDPHNPSLSEIPRPAVEMVIHDEKAV